MQLNKIAWMTVLVFILSIVIIKPHTTESWAQPSSKTKDFPLNISKQHTDSKITVKKVSIGNKSEIEIQLKRPLYRYNEPYRESVSYQIFNDSGLMLIPTYVTGRGTRKGDSVIFNIIMQFDNFPENTNYLLIKSTVKTFETKDNNPYKGKKVPEDQWIKRDLGNGFPVTLEQGDAGKISGV